MTSIDRQKIASSDIASVGYDEATEILEIEFRATGVYRYFSVPKAIHQALLTSPNPGKTFLLGIKGKYAWEKVTQGVARDSKGPSVTDPTS